MSELSKVEQKLSPLERYVAVLEAIAAARAPLGLSEVAATCNFPLGSAHRLVAGLLAAHLIVAHGTSRKTYRVGPRLLRLLHAGTDVEKIRAATQGTLEGLANRLGQTCYLARLSGDTVISVAWAVPERGVRGYVYPGDAMPPHAAASAKAIMAFQSPAFIARVLSRKLEKFTPATKINPADVKAEYELVRKQKYAVCWDEIEMGLGAVACPVELAELGVIYALGTSGVAERLQRSVKRLVTELRAALPQFERVLRHVSEAPRSVRARRPAAPKQAHRGVRAGQG